MDNKILSIILAVAIFAGGCNVERKTAVPETFSNVSVRTSYSPTAKFPAGSKYAFVEFASDNEQEPELALIYQRIQTALGDQLKKKGFKFAKYGDVDFFVAYTVGLQHEINILAAKSKEPGNNWIGVIVIPNDYVSGALLVQVIDARSMEPVWLGVFNADIEMVSVSEKQKQQRVAYAVRELLKTFPPGAINK
jgi:hypothetical protein